MLLITHPVSSHLRTRGDKDKLQHQEDNAKSRQLNRAEHFGATLRTTKAAKRHAAKKRAAAKKRHHNDGFRSTVASLFSNSTRHQAVKRNQQTTHNTAQPAQKHQFFNRIIGGNAASQGEYPFFMFWDGCGGSLIHEDIVLTAAHCGVIRSNSVRVSAYQLNSNLGGAENKRSVRSFPRPQYNEITVAGTS